MTVSARAVVVGAGMMGRWHADAVSKVGGDVVAIVDSSEEAAHSLASTVGCEAFLDLELALSSHRPDVVHICTPLDTHAALCLVALESDAHVVIEKPVASTLDEVDTILQAAERGGLVVTPVYQFLFQPGVLEALDQRRRLGRLVHLRATALSAGAAGSGPQEQDRIAVEILPHFLALASRFVGGRISEASLTLERPGAGEILLTGAHQGVGLAALVSMSSRPTRNTLEALGTTGSAYFDLFHGFASWEKGEPSRLHKAARPFLVAGARFGRAGANLATRALRRETAYPGLRELVRRAHSASISGTPAPISPSMVRDVSAAWHRLARTSDLST